MLNSKLSISALLAGACLTPAVALAQLDNGGFETGDLSGWTTAGEVFAREFELSRDFLAPVDPDWTPTEGRYFASLWSTDSDGVDSASLSQSFNGPAGAELSFDYFFDFGDIAPFYDTATAVLSWSGGSVTLFEHNTAGNEMADDENIPWTHITYLLPANDLYTLTFTTTDGVGVFESILGVDNVVIPAPASSLLALVGIGCFARRRRS